MCIRDRDNDSVQITVTAASDMYISAFQYLPEKEEGNVQRIFPNQLQWEAFVKAGQVLNIPDSDSAHGYRLAMRLPKKADRVAEALMLVATKKEVTFPERMSLSEFHRILAEIPLDDRREANFPYLIVKKGADHLINGSGLVQFQK